MIYDWVMDHGLASSIMTFYEITDGDLSETTGELHPPSLAFYPAIMTSLGSADAPYYLLESPGSHHYIAMIVTPS